MLGWQKFVSQSTSQWPGSFRSPDTVWQCTCKLTRSKEHFCAESLMAYRSPFKFCDTCNNYFANGTIAVYTFSLFWSQCATCAKLTGAPLLKLNKESFIMWEKSKMYTCCILDCNKAKNIFPGKISPLVGNLQCYYPA